MGKLSHARERGGDGVDADARGLACEMHPNDAEVGVIGIGIGGRSGGGAECAECAVQLEE